LGPAAYITAAAPAGWVLAAAASSGLARLQPARSCRAHKPVTESAYAWGSLPRAQLAPARQQPHRLPSVRAFTAMHPSLRMKVRLHTPTMPQHAKRFVTHTDARPLSPYALARLGGSQSACTLTLSLTMLSAFSPENSSWLAEADADTPESVRLRPEPVCCSCCSCGLIGGGCCCCCKFDNCCSCLLVKCGGSGGDGGAAMYCCC